MTGQLDPRLHAYRPDLADEELLGLVEAERFVAGNDWQVTSPVAPVRRAPREGAPLDTEALRGEIVRVFETRDGWAWGQLREDRYVGWLPADRLGSVGARVTHRVSALRSFVFPAPDMKRPPVMALPMNARLEVLGAEGTFARTEAGYVAARHLTPLDEPAPDWVAVAERFMGTPYLWGGRSSLGIDCSGLVQMGLAASGVACPRDSDMQAESLGVRIEHTDPSKLERGDLVFWKGHVGIAAGQGILLHANAHHMETVVEPIGEAVARISDAGHEISGIRRIAVDPA